MASNIREKLICKSLAFDGVNDRLTGPLNSIFDIEYNQPFSFGMWYKYPSTDIAIIFSKVNINVDIGYYLEHRVSSNLMRWWFFETQTNFAIWQFNFEESIDTWYHFIVTYDGTVTSGGIKMYLDGVELSQFAFTNSLTGGTVVDSTRNIEIGGNSSGPNFTNINFNTFRMWDTQLDLSQVTKEYNNGFGRLQPVLPDNCKLDLNMSKSVWDGSQFLIKDQSNNVSDFVSNNLGEDQLVTECYQI